MTGLLTTEAERKRVEENMPLAISGEASITRRPVSIEADFVLRLLADFAALQARLAEREAQLAQERRWRKQSDEVIVANEGEWALRNVKVLAPFYDEAIARHKASQQAAKGGGVMSYQDRDVHGRDPLDADYGKPQKPVAAMTIPTPTPSTESEVMPDTARTSTTFRSRPDNATPQASTLAPGADALEPDDCYERVPNGALTVKTVEVQGLREDIDKLISVVKRGQSLCASATNDVARDKFNEGVDALPRWIRERLGLARAQGGKP